MRGRRVFSLALARKRSHPDAGANAKGVTWSTMFRPFADDTMWIPVQESGPAVAECLCDFLRRERTDGFRLVSGNLQGTSIVMKCFTYDEYVNVYLERGLGLLLFLNACERRLGPRAVDTRAVGRAIADLPVGHAARTEEIIQRVACTKDWTGPVASLIEEMFAEDLGGRSEDAREEV